MTQPRLLARVEITNAQGLWDSQNPNPRLGDTLDSVRISFEVRKTLESTPNTAEITIWNLSPATVNRITGTVRKRLDWTPEQRQQLVAAGADSTPVELVYDNAGLASVRLSFGYEGASQTTSFPPLSLGFLGASSAITSITDGVDSQLVIKCEDAGAMLGAGRPTRGGSSPVSYAPGTPFATVVKGLVNALGLTINEATLTNTLRSALLSRDIPLSNLIIASPYNATSATAAEQLRTVFDGLELRWSVQDGEFVLLDSFDTLAGFPPLVIAGDSLHGQAETLESGEQRVRTWANAEARPGREVRLQSDLLGAQYRIDSVETSGDTYEGGETSPTLSEIQTVQGLF